ncbi:MAG: MBL fold metallo-hydrolase [Clostridia bacterium]|nr:MBL fold metallo-hydrolase [Clostridia bacterium]
MILKRIKVLTPYEIHTNVYIIQDELSKETMVVDPGAEVDKIIDMLDILKADLKYIYLTHCHGDHIGGVSELQRRKGGKILIHRFDAEGLTNPGISLTNFLGIDASFEPDSRLNDGDLLHLGDLEFKVIHTPGHTKGGTCLYCAKEGFLISGDTLFRGTWGRTDLPTGSLEDIMDSITRKLLILPNKTIVYPGHGKSTMIREEKPIYLELKPRLD